MTNSFSQYQAILIVGFGGPEGPDDVIPFLENVLRGRRVPRERMLEVAEHYYQFGGQSPINQQVRDLISALKPELLNHDISLPIYWGNRNWHPLLEDTLQQMADDGISRAIAFVISAYSSYSSCRQYREDIAGAQAQVGEQAPEIDKIRVFYNHPLFIEANLAQLKIAISQLPTESLESCHIAFTAHSLPCSMSDSCDYQQQLEETCRLVCDNLGIEHDRYQLVYQSRSGRPTDPWLEPDICDHLRDLHQRSVENVIVMPIGFLSDHMEIIYDLDDEAFKLCQQLKINMIRANTVGTNSAFIEMICQLIQERLNPSLTSAAIGQFGPAPHQCATNCCPQPSRPISTKPD